MDIFTHGVLIMDFFVLPNHFFFLIQGMGLAK